MVQIPFSFSQHPYVHYFVHHEVSAQALAALPPLPTLQQKKITTHEICVGPDTFDQGCQTEYLYRDHFAEPPLHRVSDLIERWLRRFRKQTPEQNFQELIHLCRYVEGQRLKQFQPRMNWWAFLRKHFMVTRLIQKSLGIRRQYEFQQLVKRVVRRQRWRRWIFAVRAQVRKRRRDRVHQAWFRWRCFAVSWHQAYQKRVALRTKWYDLVSRVSRKLRIRKHWRYLQRVHARQQMEEQWRRYEARRRWFSVCLWLRRRVRAQQRWTRLAWAWVRKWRWRSWCRRLYSQQRIFFKVSRDIMQTRLRCRWQSFTEKLLRREKPRLKAQNYALAHRVQHYLQKCDPQKSARSYIWRRKWRVAYQAIRFINLVTYFAPKEILYFTQTRLILFYRLSCRLTNIYIKLLTNIQDIASIEVEAAVEKYATQFAIQDTKRRKRGTLHQAQKNLQRAQNSHHNISAVVPLVLKQLREYTLVSIDYFLNSNVNGTKVEWDMWQAMVKNVFNYQKAQTLWNQFSNKKMRHFGYTLWFCWLHTCTLLYFLWCRFQKNSTALKFVLYQVPTQVIPASYLISFCQDYAFPIELVVNLDQEYQKWDFLKAQLLPHHQYIASERLALTYSGPISVIFAKPLQRILVDEWQLCERPEEIPLLCGGADRLSYIFMYDDDGDSEGKPLQIRIK